MAICNRDKDVSEQQSDTFAANYGAWGVTNMPLIRCVGTVDCPGIVKHARVAATGISGTPVALLQIRRFISGVGGGATVFTGGFTSLTLQAVGTSGIQTVVKAAAGSTSLNLQAGDVLELALSGADSAVTSLACDVVIQYVQDIRTYFGS